MNIRDTEDFKTGLFDVVICPVCNNETLNNYYICPHCKWEYDGTVNDDDYSSANGSTVGKYREKFNGATETENKSEENTQGSPLCSGVFWIIDTDNIENNKKYCFKIPCDTNGNPRDTQKYDLNAKSGTTYNHEKLWKALGSKFTNNKPYNYYPRGRVDISVGKATVYLNPFINTQKVQEFIGREFNLTGDNGIKKVTFKSDGSEHYKCYLNK